MIVNVLHTLWWWWWWWWWCVMCNHMTAQHLTLTMCHSREGLRLKQRPHHLSTMVIFLLSRGCGWRPHTVPLRDYLPLILPLWYSIWSSSIWIGCLLYSVQYSMRAMWVIVKVNKCHVKCWPQKSTNGPNTRTNTVGVRSVPGSRSGSVELSIWPQWSLITECTLTQTSAIKVFVFAEWWWWWWW